MQFHPTTQFGTNILITEGARGEGGYLRESGGRAVHGPLRAGHDGTGPARCRGPRDPDGDRRGPRFRAAATCTWTCGIWAGRRILKRLPGIREICLDFGGMDPIEEPIPIQPGAALHDGRRRHGCHRPDRGAEFLRGGRMCLRERPRRQSAGRQLAAGDRRVRPAGRRGDPRTLGGGARPPQPASSTSSCAGKRTASKRWLDRRRPRAALTSSARNCGPSWPSTWGFSAASAACAKR